MSMQDTSSPNVMVSFQTTVYQLSMLDKWCDDHRVNRSRVIRGLIHLLLKDRQVEEKLIELLRVSP